MTNLLVIPRAHEIIHNVFAQLYMDTYTRSRLRDWGLVGIVQAYDHVR